MKDYQAKNIRNIAVVGHGSEGKTTLVEALLYTSGTIDRQGRVEDGNTVTDSDKEEQSRQISISAAVAPLEWKDVKVNLIDVPGYFDFAGEMVGPMAVAEGAIITVGAVSGLNVGAEKAWDLCDKTHTSRMIVINQMDRENANFSRALATITDKYGSHIAPIEVPIVEGGKFTGVVCVLENKAYTGEGKTLKEIDIPANMAGDVESAREAIMEAAAGAEDELMEKYFEEGELSQEEIMHGLRQGIKDGTVVPVVCCSSLTRVGLAKLLDNLIDLMPSPAGSTLEGVNPKSATLRSASAPTISPSPTRDLVYAGRPVRGQAVASEGHFRHAHFRHASLQRQRGKGRKGRQHLLPARRQAEPGAEGVRGRHLRHFQAGQRRHRQHAVRPEQAREV